MRNLKLLTALVFLGAVMLFAFAHEMTKTTMFANTKELVHTVAAVSENELYESGTGNPPDFSNDQAEVTFLGKSRLTYKAENGKEISIKFDYGFKRLPENNQVSVMYDKAHPKRVSLEGYDHPDYGTSMFMVLMAALLVGAGVILMLMTFFMELSAEHRIYKKEKKIYGRDISGYKAVFWFKIITMLVFAAGLTLFAYSAYNIGKLMNTAPIANDELCGFVDAAVTDNGDGTHSYTFTANNGVQVTKQMSLQETVFEKNGVIKVRYLLSDPQQSYADRLSVYMGGSVAVQYGALTGLMLLGCVPFLFIVTLALEAYNRRANRKKGYVNYFKTTQADIDRIMNEEE